MYHEIPIRNKLEPLCTANNYYFVGERRVRTLYIYAIKLTCTVESVSRFRVQLL